MSRSDHQIIVTMLFDDTILTGTELHHVEPETLYRVARTCRRLWELGLADASFHQAGVSYRVYLDRSAV